MKNTTKKCIQIFVMLVFFMQAFARVVNAAQAPCIQSFKEWKAEKINEIMNQAVTMKNMVLKIKATGPVKNLPPLERQLSQLNWNLEVAQDLSVTDYFILYLSQQPQADRFKLAAQKLTATEVADLMAAYAQSLNSAPASGLESGSPGNLASQALVAPEGAK